MSIIHASKDDSGIFTCITPARYTHSVEVVVKGLASSTLSHTFEHFPRFPAVHCPNLPQRRALNASTHSTKMNSIIQFGCVDGNSLIGVPEVTCLPSGNWSAPFPICESTGSYANPDFFGEYRVFRCGMWGRGLQSESSLERGGDFQKSGRSCKIYL